MNAAIVVRQAADPIALKDEREKLGLGTQEEFLRARADETRQRLGQMRERLQKRWQLGYLGKPRLLREANEDAAQQPNQVVGALNISAQPKEVVGGPARQVVASAV